MDEQNEWVEVVKELPPEGVYVSTKIDDADGVRNEQILKLRGRLWFCADNGQSEMYVYYTPTHWKRRD